MDLFFSRVGAEGAYPEPQRTGERLHRSGAGPPGAHLSFPPEGVLPRVGHRRRARGEDPQAAEHHVEKGMEKMVVVMSNELSILFPHKK